ncbi:DUF4861 domain-containing protein [Algoriphagus antarcticus]|uniref:Uncharacterized protein DUF4861 n=1 Tax=Algoriphagus antarcticus TaxID=238540 RepID=A0A3E0DH79_9BACT|nr:DUF4861 domain-containing protein [Algoriphagus antarcticus]REG82070.1 uncharacterized protein DUF4861 [Algoriphagus antarcticus]
MIFQLILVAFQFLQPDPTFRVENKLDISRQEVVSISFAQLEKMLGAEFDPSHLQVQESKSQRPVLIQWVDIDQDDHYEELLFLADIKELETKSYKISLSDEADKAVQSGIKTFARFVPERIDDIAWENDKVAFRTYGPEAQRLTDEKLTGGTLTSGIDAWLKRVDYPIIDKWYQKYVDGGSYHKDSGEGYDPYHVGNSRGIGGVGIWIDDSLYVSKNIISHKILANGPLRSIFEVSYAPWMAGIATIQEAKRISIDLGSQLYHMEVSLKCDSPVPNLTTGITLHDGTGDVNSDPKAGWISYWETIDDTKLGTGIVADPADILQELAVRTAVTDQSHIYLILKPTKKISYYAGFAWEKAGEFSSLSEWNQYLKDFSKKLATPLILKFE